ncbi:protein-L-isoaspartate O-methyltransferase family protein [Embleya sp. NBC_00896]|uniref:protein-L-isoaspartate O-methyltransferase family protein n=1 Tax=Embleya sp. NBC_00896 TaxID=2975961 RepID=UPI003864EEC1|nr:methyltransferase domain-containing protein [Embleya sp. NBC_00896]
MTRHEITPEAGPDGLASGLIASGVLTGDWVPALKAAPRHLFVPDVIWPGSGNGVRHSGRLIRQDDPDAWWAIVHSDVPITTQWDDGAYDGPGTGVLPSSSTSMPTMVFTMLTALGVEDGDRVLELGTGTGWNAALLTARVGTENVVTIEVDPDVAHTARERLASAGFEPVCVVRDGRAGYADYAPFDRVIATASVGHVPPAWITQTRPGGVIVTPWGPFYGGEGIVRLVVGRDGCASGHFVSSSAFMRVRQERKVEPPRSKYPTEPWPAGAERGSTTLSPDDVGDWIAMFVIGVQVPGVFLDITDGGTSGDEPYRFWLFDTDITSWATADYVPGADTFEIAQSGPRHLWTELETAWRWWDNQDRPDFDRFGLTVHPDGTEQVWLDDPSHPVPTNPCA